MKFILYLFAMFVLSSSVVAQPDSLWTRTYGGDSTDICWSVVQTSDGGYALAGYSWSFGSGDADFWLLKTDSNGNSTWDQTYGGSGREACYAMCRTEDGGYALAGCTESFGSGDTDFWLVKISEHGDSLWSRTYGGSDYDNCYAVKQTDDGGYVLAGSSLSFGDETSAWLVKTDANGDSLWSSRFRGVCRSVEQTADGGYILAGYRYNMESGYDFWMAKTDADGDSLWSRVFRADEEDRCYSVRQTVDGGYLLSGYTDSFGAGGYDFILLKVSFIGDSLWSRTYGGDRDDECYTAQLTPDGGCVLAGKTRSYGTGYGDFWLLKVDSEGDSVWSRAFGRDYSHVCYSVQQTTDGGFVLAGKYMPSSSEDQTDIWLVKTGPDPMVDTDEHFTLSPSSFILSVYPNPFNPSTTIRYDLSRQEPVTVTVYDIMGRQIAELVNRTMPAGSHTIHWDGSNCASGVYLISLSGPDFRQTQKTLLLR